MIRFTVRRALTAALVLLGILFFVNFGMGLSRGSGGGQGRFDLIREIETAWDTSRGVMRRLTAGDFGTVETKVGPLPLDLALRISLGNSLGLLVIALAIATALGLLFGIGAALLRSRVFTASTLAITLIGISTPSFVAAVMLQQGEVLFLDATGRRLVSVAGFGWDLEHMLLPILVLSARPLAYIARSSYLGLTSIMREDFIRTAHSKGLRRQRVVLVHALRNFAIPALTTLGVSIRFAMSTLPVAEYMFAWPGMGFYLIHAITAHQVLFVIVLALAMGVLFLATNYLLELSYRLLDPRLGMDT